MVSKNKFHISSDFVNFLRSITGKFCPKDNFPEKFLLLLEIEKKICIKSPVDLYTDTIVKLMLKK